MPKKGEHTGEEVRKKISQAKKGKKLSEENRVKFVEGTRKYDADFIRVHGHHPSKGRHPVTEFKKGNTLWVGRHHTPNPRENSLSLSREDASRWRPALRNPGRIWGNRLGTRV